MNVIKRDGTEVTFDKNRIYNAIMKAYKEVRGSEDEEYIKTAQQISESLDEIYQSLNMAISVEQIQDDVELAIMEAEDYDVAKAYIKYRYIHELNRNNSTVDESILSLCNGTNEVINQENSNKKSKVASTQRDYMAGEISKDISDRKLLPEDIVQADRDGIIHFHDKDYFTQRIHNCCLVNLEDMLQNGTKINEVMIEKPHSIEVACTIASQIMAQVASCQYGGQSISLAHLAPFVDVSRQKIRSKVIEELKDIHYDGDFDRAVESITHKRLTDSIKAGIQTIQYQVNTLMTTNGQAPFITIFMYLNEVEDGQLKDDLALLIEEVVKQRIQGLKNEKGVWVTPAFPKLIYVLEDDNINEGDKYYELTKLCARCSAKRLVPDYISEKVMKQVKIDDNGDGQCYTCMGCRSFLTPYIDENGNPKYYGRFNQGVVTINLPDVGLSAHKDFDAFWRIFDERLELCHKALRIRHERLLGTLSDTSPIHWQAGALARLEKGEPIDKLLYGGYSTLSLGYAGLYECVKAMTGRSHTDPEAEPFALLIMQHMNDKCAEWRAAEDIAYSLYGTPIESTTYKFAKALKKRFGIIEGITDKNYITNSYHVHVTEHIDAFKKLDFEAEFQKLSPGGAISYIESANLEDNIDAVMAVLHHIYDHIIYAEINTKSDYCQVCGWDKEIEIKQNEHGKYIWRCPCCGNTDESKMNIARRTCGLTN